MKALPYILYAAALTYIMYRVAKNAATKPPQEERHADWCEYDEVTGRFYDPITHDEVFPEFE